MGGMLMKIAMAKMLGPKQQKQPGPAPSQQTDKNSRFIKMLKMVDKFQNQSPKGRLMNIIGRRG